MSALLTISAKIYFLSPEEGGRKTPIFSGYRPALYFGKKQTDGAIMLTSGGRAVPGTECEVIINLPLAQDQAPLTYTPPSRAEKILTSRAALEGERKQVTVLFADLKGSMELLAERDPEEARQLLDPVLDRMMAAVHQYEGTVNQVMGDGIMALFGAPLAREDHAVRACYAALRMQEAVQQYAAEVQRSHGVPIHIRVGLNAGEVVVRSIGSDLHMDYTAVGQTTHLAARMEQMAMPGSILITQAVLGLVEGLVQVKALGAMPVRGLRDPVEVYEVTGAGVVRSRLQAAAARGLTSFVGRQPELEALQQALAQAQAGHGQVVAMVGEAGVGKSRLLYEFGHSAMRGEAWDKAVAYNRQAGARVAARSAYREAVAYFEQALTALAQLPERRATLEQAIDLRFDLRNALFPLDEQARIFDHLHAAEALAEVLDDPQRFGWIACYLCNAFSAMSEHDRAIAAGQRALALATTSGAFDVQVIAQTSLGIAYYAAGDFRQTLAVSRRVMALLTGELRYERFGTTTLPAVTSRGLVAQCLAALGDFAEGRGIAEEAVRLAEAIEQPFSIASALWCAGLFYRRQGAFHTAIPVLERGLTLYQTANIPTFLPLVASILGAAYALTGRAAEALSLLDEVLERVATGRLLFLHALVLTELSEACLLVGRVDEASTLAGHLLELSRAYTGSSYQAHAYRLLGEIAMRREPPDVDQAAGHYRQALTLAEELGMRPLQAHCHLGLGALYARTGQRQQAHAELSAAIDLYRAMDMTFWLPQAETALAQVKERQG